MKEVIKTLQSLEDGYVKAAREIRDKLPAESFALFKISESLRKAREFIRSANPERVVRQEKELEGGGWCWWHVCPECHGAIDPEDHWCKHCGQALETEKIVRAIQIKIEKRGEKPDETTGTEPEL